MNSKKSSFVKPIVLLISLVLYAASTSIVFADIKLPAVISDNMVLQRGKKAKIWGRGDPGEQIMVSVSWHSMGWSVVTNGNGDWSFDMSPPKTTGPHEITLRGKNTITIKNILVGEVWVCSGQSNMQWSVRQSANPEQEIAGVNYEPFVLFCFIEYGISSLNAA